MAQVLMAAALPGSPSRLQTSARKLNDQMECIEKTLRWAASRGGVTNRGGLVKLNDQMEYAPCARLVLARSAMTYKDRILTRAAVTDPDWSCSHRP